MALPWTRRNVSSGGSALVLQETEERACHGPADAVPGGGGRRVSEGRAGALPLRSPNIPRACPSPQPSTPAFASASTTPSAESPSGATREPLTYRERRGGDGVVSATSRAAVARFVIFAWGTGRYRCWSRGSRFLQPNPHRSSVTASPPQSQFPHVVPVQRPVRNPVGIVRV